MAACKGVCDGIIAKYFTNLRVFPWLLRKNKPVFLLKCQTQGGHFTTSARFVQINCEISRSYEQYKKYNNTLYNCERRYCTSKIRELDELTFHTISDETLNVLMEYFEELGDLGYFDQDYDIEYSDGVLTVRLGENHGTYVINKQTPNKQIWLSSPTSGPKRYDFTESNCWIYRHDGVSLHERLSEEISGIIGRSVSFTDLQYGGGTSS